MPTEQKWLSLTGICNVLQTTAKHIRWLVKNGYLEMIPGPTGNQWFVGARFLDPTPQYAERLRTTEMIYGRRVALPAEIDLDPKCIFTRSEIAALTGWRLNYIELLTRRKKLPFVKAGTRRGAVALYSALTVREIIRHREKRSTSKQHSPFLLQHLITWFQKQQAETESLTPTAAEVAADDKLHRQIKKLLSLPAGEKTAAVRDLWEKVETAKAVAVLLK